MIEYHWKSGFFERNYKLTTFGVEAGEIRYDNLFSSKATAVIDNKTYRLQTNNFMEPEIIAKNEKGDRYVIDMNLWRSKADFEDKWNWESNIQFSSWKWKDSDGNLIVKSENHNWSGNRGIITVHNSPGDVDHHLLVLVGLYTYNYHMELVALIIILFIVFII